MIKIDGSYAEGGGQILRTAIALACITGEEVEVFNIRANRPKPGLAMQHLKGIESAKMISRAEVENANLGSTRVVFKPKTIRGGRYKINIGTAGSITLILQTILPPVLFANEESVFEIIGGTDVNWSPTIDYFKNVTMRALEKLGVELEIKLLNRGYYPKGGGKVLVKVEPSKLKGFKFERKEIKTVKGVSHCSNLPYHVAERQKRVVERVIEDLGLKCDIKTEVLKELSTGSGITIWGGYKGASSLGERGKPAEKVGEEAVNSFIEELNSQSAFDRHLADQVMIFSAVANGKTEYTTSVITKHVESNKYVIESFFGKCIEFNNNRIIISGKGL